MEVIDQQTGAPIMSLYSDPTLTWQIANEIKRQSAGLESSLQSAQSAQNWSGNAGFGQNQNNQEAANIQSSINLLNLAAQSLGNVPPMRPPMTPPPVPGAFQVFTGVWMTGDGQWLVLKRPDGSLAYMNGKGWYADQGHTKLAQPYPAQFKSVVASYLNKLDQESASTRQALMQDQQEGSQRLQMLQQNLQQFQTNPVTAQYNPTAAVDSSVPPQEANRRLNNQIRKTERRLAAIQNQLNLLPQETAAATKMLAQLQS
jgi:hypothetical protein